MTMRLWAVSTRWLCVLIPAAALIGCGDDAGTPVATNGVGRKLPAQPPSLSTQFPIGTATSTQLGADVATVLRNPAGSAVLARLYWNAGDGVLTWTVTGVGTETWPNSGGFIPTLEGSNHAVALIYDRAQAGLGKTAKLDEPGCDWIPDFLETECMLQCCATHGQCYADHDCNWTSWIPDGQLTFCDLCNLAVVLCFAQCFGL